MRFASSLIMLVAIVLAGCSGRTPPPNPAAAGGEAAPVQSTAVEQVAKQPPAPPPSRHAALREGIDGWLKLASTCQKRWFAKVDPAKLDKWELPVDVPSMDDDCDKLVFDFEALSKENLLKDLTDSPSLMAMVTDLIPTWRFAAAWSASSEFLRADSGTDRLALRRTVANGGGSGFDMICWFAT